MKINDYVKGSLIAAAGVLSTYIILTSISKSVQKGERLQDLTDKISYQRELVEENTHKLFMTYGIYQLTLSAQENSEYKDKLLKRCGNLVTRIDSLESEIKIEQAELERLK